MLDLSTAAEKNQVYSCIKLSVNVKDVLLSSWFASGIYNAYQKSDAFFVKNHSLTNKSDHYNVHPTFSPLSTINS